MGCSNNRNRAFREGEVSLSTVRGQPVSLIPPFLSVLVAALVAWIAYQQYRLAQERFKLDLFDKRFAVFEATRTFLRAIVTEAKLDLDELFRYRRETQDATFLFGPEIDCYLRSLADKALEMRAINEQFDPLPKGPERSALCAQKTKLLRELVDESTKLKDVFAPDLRLASWK